MGMGDMGRYAFLRRPKWIFGHLIVLALVVGFISAGFWQLRRLDQRRTFNAQVETNMAKPAAPIRTVLPQDAAPSYATTQLNRKVTATGTYLADKEIIITGQASRDSVPGVWVVSPLLLDDGTVLLVNRGWLPSTGQITKPLAAAKPPTGTVTVTGLLSATQTGSAGRATERSAAYQSSFLRIDIARIQQQFDERLVRAFVQRTDQKPADSGSVVPERLPPPELSEGPHASYAFQWFSFTLVALIAYPILLRSMAKDRVRSKDAPIDLPPGAFIDEDGIIDLTEVERPSDSAEPST